MNRKLTKSIKHQSWLMDDPKNWQLMYSVGRSSCPIKWIECGTMTVEFLGMSPLQKTEKHVHVHHTVYIRFLKLLCQPHSIKVSRRKQFDTEFGSKAHAALLRRWLINYAYSFLLSGLLRTLEIDYWNWLLLLYNGHIKGWESFKSKYLQFPGHCALRDENRVMCEAICIAREGGDLLLSGTVLCDTSNYNLNCIIDNVAT